MSKDQLFEVLASGAWDIEWTGWKSNQQNAELCGQWIATPISADGREDPTRLQVYSATGGKVSNFYPGNYFDVSVEWGHFRVSQNTPAAIREHERERALHALLTALDQTQTQEKSA